MINLKKALEEEQEYLRQNPHLRNSINSPDLPGAYNPYANTSCNRQNNNEPSYMVLQQKGYCMPGRGCTNIVPYNSSNHSITGPLHLKVKGGDFYT